MTRRIMALSRRRSRRFETEQSSVSRVHACDLEEAKKPSGQTNGLCQRRYGSMTELARH